MINDVNFTSSVEKAESVVKAWHNRSLTLHGKIQVVNSLVSSLFIYKLQVLPMPVELNMKFRQIITDFIWNGRKPKIRLNTLVLDHKDGGRRVTDMKCRNDALKMQWIARLYDNDDTLTELAHYNLNAKIKDQLFWECNLKECDVNILECKNEFWKQTVTAWSRINFHDPTAEQIPNQILWYNSHIRIKNVPVCIKKMYEKGVLYVKDLYMNGKIMSHEEITELYELDLDIMTHNALISAIPTSWKKRMRDSMNYDMEKENMYNSLRSKTKWSGTLYNTLIKSNQGRVGLINTLKDKFDIEIDEKEAGKIFLQVNKTSQISKYRSFQYKVLQNAIVLNDRLCHYGLWPSNTCEQCSQEKQTAQHFFVKCQKTVKVWRDVVSIFEQKYNCKIDVNEKEYITCVTTEDKLGCIALICMVFKQKMYAAKCMKKEPNAHEIMYEIEFIHGMEKSKAISRNKQNMYNKRWPDKIPKNDEQTVHQYLLDM